MLPSQLLVLQLILPVMYSAMSVSHKQIDECRQAHFPKEPFELLEFDNIFSSIRFFPLEILTCASNSVRWVQLDTLGFLKGVFKFG